MPNQRAEGQKLINVPMKIKLIEELDAAAKDSGYEDRSKFIRDAIKEKLKRDGYHVSDDLFEPPSRFGKGGPSQLVVVVPGNRRNQNVEHEITVLEERGKASGPKYPPHKPSAQPVHDKPIPGTNSKKVSGAARASKSRAAKIAGVSPKPSR